MAIPQNILADLAKPEISSFHNSALNDSKELVNMSRNKMCEYYPRWDKSYDVFKSITRPDQEDKEARERKEPEKLVVPTGYSQTMTFAAFCYSLYTQRERMFELQGVATEDHKPAKVGEAVLQRDLAENNFEVKLFQFLLDVCRFTLGVFEVSWARETRMMKREVQSGTIKNLFGKVFGARPIQTQEEVVTYLGNRIMNVSPYKFFPDVRLPLTRFQEGEFVASEDEFSYSSLKQMEHEGLVAGIDHVKSISREVINARKSDTRLSFSLEVDPRFGDRAVGQSKHPILVTKVQRNIIPKQYEIDGEPVGPEDYPVKWLIWYANDSRIIRMEPLDYPHGKFTYELAQFIPDQHELIGLSLSDVVDSLQSVITWFINSHISSVRKVIDNRLVVDPSRVEMSDLLNRNPVIRLKPVAANRGAESYVHQLKVTDVTARHLEDVRTMRELVQETTGISDAMLGQFHQGRRSATEARNVSGGSASRLKMIAAQIYRSALEPMAKQMLDNLRVGLDEETIVKVVGLDAASQGASFMKVSKADLAGDVAFEIFDGTLPSERIFNAQALMELLAIFIPNPQAAIALGLDPRAILYEALELRGIRNPVRFSLSPPTQPAQPLSLPNGIEQIIQAGAGAGLPSPTGESVLPFPPGGSTTGEV